MNQFNKNFARGRILVVDDEESYAEMIYGILRQHHYATDKVTDAEEALEMILDNDYQLIVTDYQMPALNGVQLVEKIREAGLSIPVIIISGMMHTPELQRAVNMGSTSVLQKPTETAAFLEHVNKYLPKQELKGAQAISLELEAKKGVPGKNGAVTENIFTFPSHVKHLSAHAQATKRCLQTLWDSSRAVNQLFFRIPQGGDSLQITWQLASWKGFDEVPVEFINVADLGTADTLEHLDALANSKKHSELVVVDCQSASIKDYFGGLNRHIEEAHNYSRGSRELSFIYWFSHESWELFLTLQNDNLKGFCERYLVDIPPLNERLPDLAEYASRLTQGLARRLKRTNRQSFSAGAINLLLHTEWEGNYSQLSLALSKVVSIGSDEEISAEDLAKCISGEAVESVQVQMSKSGSEQLRSFLCGIQKRFIRRKSQESSIEIAPYYAADEGLIYPDLISPDPETAV